METESDGGQMLLLRAKGEGGGRRDGEGDSPTAPAQMRCRSLRRTSLRSRLDVQTRAIWSWLEAERRASGRFLSPYGTGREQPPQRDCRRREGLERLQPRFMFFWT